MRWSFQNRIQTGFWLLTIIPFVLAFMAFRSTRALVSSADDVRDTHRVIRKLEQVLSQLKDIEVSQREFILTGDEGYLGPYLTGRPNVDRALRELEDMTAANERQHMWMEHLKVLVPQKLDELRRSVELRRSQGVEAASQAVLAGRGTRAIDDIRTVIRNMTAEEERLLYVRTGEQRQSFFRTISLFVALLVFNLALIWMLYYLVKRDTTERKREEQVIRQLNADLERRVEHRTEALRRSNEDLQQFAYVASHDLKEPLRAVSSYTELLARRYKGRLDADADDYITFILDGVRRMNLLIQDLLDYSKAGEIPEESVAPVDTNAVLENVLNSLQVTITEAHASIAADTLPTVACDPMRLAQLFQNLIDNAIKYRGEQNPEVRISASQTESETLFCIRDNGIGIDEKHLNQIFGIFKRLHGKEFEGTGIGLATCKKIVERQGGRIWAESKVGEGTAFFFTIPHETAARAAKAGDV
ncbi:MAG: sensor histidine kinase [Bryobacteraceae bacterium]